MDEQASQSPDKPSFRQKWIGWLSFWSADSAH